MSITNPYQLPDVGTLFKPSEWRLINNQTVKFSDVVVHEFRMGDVEDPDLYAAQPLYDWEKSEAGQWVMKNAADTPTWYRMADPMSFGYQYQIRAKLMGPALTEWLLRYGNK